MRFSTSYFYQIRNFRLYNSDGKKVAMVPISTALFDPKWYIACKKKGFPYFDEHKIIIGFNDATLHPNKEDNYCLTCKDTSRSALRECEFLQKYKAKLDAINPEEFIKKYEAIADTIIALYRNKSILIDDVEFVFCVHEALYNLCSERRTIQEFLKQFNLGYQEFDPKNISV